MTQESIRIEGLGKRYRIGVAEDRHDTLVGGLWSLIVSPISNLRQLRSLKRFDERDSESVLWALRDVSLVVPRGQVLGVIGKNGAGKSTLLKILSRIVEPTEGCAEISGRVASLLEIGTGFHSDLTGRENIYLNGTLLGMTRDEVDQKLDEIIEFSGISSFIDTPVKRYSSGMSVRLGFAVAAHLEPEILLIDEVLAVGDAAFRKKCLGKMEDVARQGRTVLFVSHNMATIESLCDRAVALERGGVVDDGSPREVIRRYLDQLDEEEGARLRTVEDSERRGNGAIRFVGTQLLDDDGGRLSTLRTGSPAVISLEYEKRGLDAITSMAIHIRILTQLGQQVAHLSNEFNGQALDMPPSDSSKIEIRVDRLPISQGRYRCNIYARVNGIVADRVKDAFVFDVEPGDFYGTGRVPPGEGVLFDYSFRYH